MCVCVSVCLFVLSESEFCSQHKKKQNAIPKSSSDIFLGAKEDAWGIKKCSMLLVSFSSLITHTHTHRPRHTLTCRRTCKAQTQTQTHTNTNGHTIAHSRAPIIISLDLTSFETNHFHPLSQTYLSLVQFHSKSFPFIIF